MCCVHVDKGRFFNTRVSEDFVFYVLPQRKTECFCVCGFVILQGGKSCAKAQRAFAKKFGLGRKF